MQNSASIYNYILDRILDPNSEEYNDFPPKKDIEFILRMFVTIKGSTTFQSPFDFQLLKKIELYLQTKKNKAKNIHIQKKEIMHIPLNEEQIFLSKALFQAYQHKPVSKKNIGLDDIYFGLMGYRCLKKAHNVQTSPITVCGKKFILNLNTTEEKKSYEEMLQIFSKTKTGKKLLDKLSPSIEINIRTESINEASGKHCNNFIVLHSNLDFLYKIAVFAHELSHAIAHQKNPSFFPNSFQEYLIFEKNDELNARLIESEMIRELQKLYPFKRNLYSYDLYIIKKYRLLGYSKKEAQKKWAIHVLNGSQHYPIPPQSFLNKTIQNHLNRFEKDMLLKMLVRFLPKSLKRKREEYIQNLFYDSLENQRWNIYYNHQAFKNYQHRLFMKNFSQPQACFPRYNPLGDISGIYIEPEVWEKNMSDSGISETTIKDTHGNLKYTVLRYTKYSLRQIFNTIRKRYPFFIRNSLKSNVLTQKEDEFTYITSHDKGDNNSTISMKTKNERNKRKIIFKINKSDCTIDKSILHDLININGKLRPKKTVIYTKTTQNKKTTLSFTQLDYTFDKKGNLRSLQIKNSHGITNLTFNDKKQIINRQCITYKNLKNRKVKAPLFMALIKQKN